MAVELELVKEASCLLKRNNEGPTIKKMIRGGPSA